MMRIGSVGMLDQTEHFSHKSLQASPVGFRHEHFGERENEVTSVQVPGPVLSCAQWE